MHYLKKRGPCKINGEQSIVYFILQLSRPKQNARARASWTANSNLLYLILTPLNTLPVPGKEADTTTTWVACFGKREAKVGLYDKEPLA